MIKKLQFIFLTLYIIGCSSSEKEIDTMQKSLDIRSKIEENAKRIESNFSHSDIPDFVINIDEFSNQKADAEGTFDFYHSINQAIKTLSDSGGGTLIFPHPQGRKFWFKQTMRYRIRGPIHLESNIRILIDHGVELFFEFHPESYLPDGKPVLTRWEGTLIQGYSPLFYAFNKTNVMILAREGSGAMPKISGDGEKWVQWHLQGDKYRNEVLKERISKKSLRETNANKTPIGERIFTEKQNFFFRPAMIEFIFCKNVYMSGLHLNDSPFWTVHPVFSENLWFDGLFYTVQNANNDGFDPESCKNIIIENCIFNNHDDNLAVKSGRDTEGREGIDMRGTPWENAQGYYNKNGIWQGPSFDIVMRNCTFKGHHAVTIGSEVSGGAYNIFVYDNVAPQEVLHLVYLKSSRKRGGYIRDVYVDNLIANKCKKVVALIPNYDKADSLDPFVPEFANVFIQHVIVNQTNDFIEATGWKEKPLKNIWLYNIQAKKVMNEPFNVINLINGEFYQIQYDSVLIDTVIENAISDAKPKHST